MTQNIYAAFFINSDNPQALPSKQPTRFDILSPVPIEKLSHDAESSIAVAQQFVNDESVFYETYLPISDVTGKIVANQLVAFVRQNRDGTGRYEVSDRFVGLDDSFATHADCRPVEGEPGCYRSITIGEAVKRVSTFDFRQAGTILLKNEIYLVEEPDFPLQVLYGKYERLPDSRPN